MRIRIASACLVVSMGIGVTHAHAAPLFGLSGRVALLDGATPEGVKVVVGLDLDRDGKLNSFETLSASVSADGSYHVEYSPNPSDVDFQFLAFVTQLAVDFRARGFDAITDDGPLPVMVRFERKGYSTIVKRFTTLTDVPSLDAALDALASVGCTSTGCQTADGSLSLSGFPAGTKIARAFARAYDPAEDGAMFPGTFSDSAGNLLISSGFAEINLHDSSGKKITSMSSPVSVRFEARRASWASLRDLEPDSGRIEVPMYSFDESIAEWVSELPGELQAADGTPIPEDQFASIQRGAYASAVYIAFQTKHFSTFNCDAPIQERACVKGRIVTEGKAVAGVAVDAQGVSYRGSAGEVLTGADGSFAVDVMRSEKRGEDYDRNRVAGETFRAQVKARLGQQSFQGAAFDTPGNVGSAGSRTGKRCKPKECECVDLGDIEVDFEIPRPCEITVEARASGKTFSRVNGPLTATEPLATARLSGRLSGALWVPQPGPNDCLNAACFSAQANAQGSATFVVPVIGDAPKIELTASLKLWNAEGEHSYETRLIVDGCAKGEAGLSVPVSVEAPHVLLEGFASSSSGSGTQPPRAGGTSGSPESARRSGCSLSPGRPSGSLYVTALGLAWIGFWMRRASNSPKRSARR